MKTGNALPALAALSGAIAVIAGAFGAHVAHGVATEWLKTGGQYQMVHAVAAIAVLNRGKGASSAWLFLLGSAIFSGTLYAMALGAPRFLGAVTPLGGLLMILGWLLTAWQLVRR